MDKSISGSGQSDRSINMRWNVDGNMDLIVGGLVMVELDKARLLFFTVAGL